MLTHLAADRALVTDLDAKILDLERSIFTLRTEKRVAQERLDSYKYPVLTLPTDITTEIFIHFLPPYPDYAPLAGHESPTLLAQICREWREIALETPTLWRAMSPSDPSISFELKAHLVDTWLSRSRCCPLSIHFSKYDFDAELHAIEILSALVPHRTRWEHLDLTLSPSHIAIIQGSMPLLCHLDLTVLSDLNDIATFSPAPLLRSITLCATTPLRFVFPLQQITSLNLYAVFRSDYVAILQQTSNLVHCELRVEFDRGDSRDLPPEHAIELPRLESLVLTNDETPDGVGFLNDFLVPALRSLRIGKSFLGAAPIDELASFISKSGCKLQRVCLISSIEELWISGASYREAFPSIHRFSFVDCADAASISTNSTNQ
ncbi:hypothetical protein K438DRAFT_1812257 [Mycena galopus ATCC 62051]|nr:hypothetical protein K438DRAFT_1812257 [Mycena galopus ATCC 62051]